MYKLYRPVRVGLIFLAMAVVLTIYVSALYKLQIYESRPPDDELYPRRTITRTVTLPAARGNIYDRNGVLLASGRPTYNISLNRQALLYDPDRNNVIQELIMITMDHNILYNDTFPITRGAPFTYVSNMTNDQRNRLNAYFAFFNMDPEISASDLLASMRSRYGIDYTVGIAEARLIIGVRYELEIRAIVGTIPPYVFAHDVSFDYISILEERSLTGVFVDIGYIREYNTIYAAHLLGYIRQMSPEQYEVYRELGYPMDALVGQTGAELAFEELLHGVDGKQEVTISDNGTVMNVVTLREPAPGDHIYLTMDIDLQMAVEHALSAHIDLLNIGREEEGDLITGGAAVVLDVRTGEILAAASYPTFNPMTLSRDYSRLAMDSTWPLLNRATQGRYNPGSTFKMVTGFAGLRYGVIDRYFPVNDTGPYEVLGDIEGGSYRPTCWYYQLNGVGHGELDIVHALEQSCNYFFMYIADRVGGSDGNVGGGPDGALILAEVAQEFGLGRRTGLEIPENPGRLATPEFKREVLNDIWYRADTVMTGFGQGHNLFTPVQLANYAATIANGGTLHSLTLLRRIKSADNSELLYVHEPEVLNVIEETEYIEMLQEGMRAVARSRLGTAYRVFGDYPIRIAAKTGTVQSESADINNGVFICYAPADDPQIAIAVVIEKGGSGGAVMDVARMIFDYYFRSETSVLATPYGELIP